MSRYEIFRSIPVSGLTAVGVRVLESMTSDVALEAIENSLEPGEKILWHSAPDPAGSDSYRQSTRLVMRCAVAGMAIIMYGRIPLTRYLSHHGAGDDTHLYWLATLVVVLVLAQYLFWEAMIKKMPSWLYVLTDLSAFSVGSNGGNRRGLLWSKIHHITLRTNKGRWDDLVFVPASMSGEKAFSFLCVPDAQQVYEQAEALRSA